MPYESSEDPLNPIYEVSSKELHFHIQSDQVQIIDLLRWIRKAHNVSTWMSPWPERTAMSLGPTELISWEQTMNGKVI